MFLRKSALFAVCGLLGAFALGGLGCGGSNITNSNDSSLVRVFNGVSRVPGTNGAVHIFQRGASLNAQPLAYGTAQSGGLAQVGVVSNYGVVASGTNIDTLLERADTGAQLGATQKVDFTRAFDYTLVAIGIFGQTGASVPQVIRLTDNIPNLQGTASAAIRVVHAAATVQPISVFNTAAGAATAIIGLTNLSYSNSSGYITVQAGTYDLTIRDNAGNVVAAPNNLAALQLVAGKSYTLMVIGEGAGGVTPVTVTVLQDF